MFLPCVPEATGRVYYTAPSQTLWPLCVAVAAIAAICRSRWLPPLFPPAPLSVCVSHAHFAFCCSNRFWARPRIYMLHVTYKWMYRANIHSGEHTHTHTDSRFGMTRFFSGLLFVPKERERTNSVCFSLCVRVVLHYTTTIHPTKHKAIQSVCIRPPSRRIYKRNKGYEMCM